MSVAPKSGEPTTKMQDGKTFHWCPHHSSWNIHKPEDCRKKEQTKPEKGKKKGSSAQLRMKVMQTLAELDSEDEESSQSSE